VTPELGWLSLSEQALLRECLAFVATTRELSDEDFATRLGVDRSDLAAILLRWPGIDAADRQIWLTVHNALNEVATGLPISPHAWAGAFTAPRTSVAALLATWDSVAAQK
jgi:hypothetical protein